MPQLRSGLIGASLAIGSLALAATSWKPQLPRSEIRFEAIQEGAAFTGKFERFDARIRFDPAQLAASSIEVRIDLASVDTADSERDDTLRGDDFFAVGRWPAAQFTAHEFVLNRDGSYTAQGRLTLRDVTRAVPITFRFERNADAATLVGAAKVNRLDFGVGQGDWRDTESLGNEVRVRYSLTLTPE
jgi:polyisoprenoid-binding protein YceI